MIYIPAANNWGELDARNIIVPPSPPSPKPFIKPSHVRADSQFHSSSSLARIVRETTDLPGETLFGENPFNDQYVE